MQQPKHLQLVPRITELLNISAQYFDLPTCGDTEKNQECCTTPVVCRLNLIASKSNT